MFRRKHETGESSDKGKRKKDSRQFESDMHRVERREQGHISSSTPITPEQRRKGRDAQYGTLVTHIDYAKQLQEVSAYHKELQESAASGSGDRYSRQIASREQVYGGERSAPASSSREGTLIEYEISPQVNNPERTRLDNEYQIAKQEIEARHEAQFSEELGELSESIVGMNERREELLAAHGSEPGEIQKIEQQYTSAYNKIINRWNAIGHEKASRINMKIVELNYERKAAGVYELLAVSWSDLPSRTMPENPGGYNIGHGIAEQSGWGTAQAAHNPHLEQRTTPGDTSSVVSSIDTRYDGQPYSDNRWEDYGDVSPVDE